MGDDIRLNVSFKSHPKRTRLASLLSVTKGPADYLTDLWISIRQLHPDGDLSSWDEFDIAISAGWEGEPKVFVNALVQCGWLEKHTNGKYSCHGWTEHQSWATAEPERRAQARQAQNIRWARYYCNKECTGVYNVACHQRGRLQNESQCRFHSSYVNAPVHRIKEESKHDTAMKAELDEQEKKRQDTIPKKTRGTEKVTHGTFSNVKLSEAEYNNLMGKYTEAEVESKIENLSAYKASKGVRYKSDYATMLNWERMNKEGGGNGRTRDNTKARPGSVNYKYTRPD